MRDFIIGLLMGAGAGVLGTCYIVNLTPPEPPCDKPVDSWQENYERGLKNCIKEGGKDYDCIHWLNGGCFPKSHPSPSPTPSPRWTTKYSKDDDE